MKKILFLTWINFVANNALAENWILINEATTHKTLIDTDSKVSRILDGKKSLVHQLK